MGSFSIWHWAILLILAINFIPVVLILRKMGFSGWLSLVVLVPLGGYVMLWVLAFIRWPVEHKVAARTETFS